MMATATARPVMTGGTLPIRVGHQGELRRLTNARDTALRVYDRYHDHDSEIEYARAQGNLDDFLEQHPEFR